MIPSIFPSIESLLLLLAGLGAALALLGWLAVLAASRGARRRFGRRPWRNAVVLVLLAALASPYAAFQYHGWRYSREQARRDAARHVTLAQPQTVGGVSMPAGARLVLEKEGDLETYVEAAFDVPVPAYGLRVTRLQRYLRVDYEDETYAEAGRYPLSVHAWGPGAQQIEGWHCDATQAVRFEARAKGREIVFDACWLAAGNRAGETALPAGTELQRLGEMVYTDGHREPAPWMARVPESAPVRVAGLRLGPAVLHLDGQGGLLQVSTASLACRVRLAGAEYPAGTAVMSAGYLLRDRAPAGAWVFSPVAGAADEGDGRLSIGGGMFLLRHPGGGVFGIPPNAAAGEPAAECS